jgi:hypothetical protein
MAAPQLSDLVGCTKYGVKSRGTRQTGVVKVTRQNLSCVACRSPSNQTHCKFSEIQAYIP